jgi:hypothetical protein
MKMFLLPKNLSHIICHPFQMMSNINRCIISIQTTRNILKKKAIWDEQLKKFNLKGEIQNEIGFSYLGHLGVGLI